MTSRGGSSGGECGRTQTGDFWQECLRLRPGLIRAANRFGATADAEDIVHEAFLRAAGHPDLDLDRLTRFLLTVTRRLCVDDVRRRVTLQAIAVDPRLRPVPSPGPEETVVGREEARWLMARYGRLSERERVVLSGLQQGMSHEELARLLGTTRRATESVANRARRRVRGLMTRRPRQHEVAGD
ncbi:RNA polymerase sigma-70 factor, ECF subfamily [Amycolatopsis arida]|uniref:RNA polymerase sigma-70 factor, ECF subfamily n=1 Tax=Amycolatopsis arida TaxID=587909 RepID=A0A1I5ST13_9PSEU|nr:sigma-70 family RNA polymerase sigma factor [Amycolatopsis arida]TDX96364.1 RNA polymerase sigma-70 factor (ECF subfamily) [Amycolatopsis arida]SFP73771.1 RNA polymerase sigma-70 factor, ECF subfamily [Amycolatopsis arida]